MEIERRKFMQWMAAASTVAVGRGGDAKMLSLFGRPSAGAADTPVPGASLQRNLLTPQKEVWDWQTWMAALGPKFTGNPAHDKYMEFIADKLNAIPGLETTRDNIKFSRWNVGRYSIRVNPAAGQGFDVPITSYYGYSGQTTEEGVTAELAYGGSYAKPQLSNLEGKIAFVEHPNEDRPWGKIYSVWGTAPASEKLPDVSHPVRPHQTALSEYKKAGAVGVILAWTNVSDSAAKDQYPFAHRPIANIPALFVGRQDGIKLRELIGTGTKVNLTLTAEMFPNTSTDHLWSTLPGTSSDEVILINTHTDGPNAPEENGSLALIALARYFAKLPKEQRKRTLVFLNSTGHLCESYVGGTAGAIKGRPDVIKKSIAAVTIEHLGCSEWIDDIDRGYHPTGKDDWGIAITPSKILADVMLESTQVARGRWGIVNQLDGNVLGVGQPINRAGVPIIQYIDQVGYLEAAPADGFIGRLNPEVMQSQIEVFAKAIHKLDAIPSELLTKANG